MKRKTLFILAVLGSFTIGFALNEITSPISPKPEFKRVTGIGGIFFKSENPVELKKWYQAHLGLKTDQYGTNFQWYKGSDSTQLAFTQWSPFNAKTKYFLPSTKEFMINYRVADLEKLAKALKEEGVTIVDTIATYEYGKFLHIMDPEGNKIELWEPFDENYHKFVNVDGVTK